MKPKNMLVRLPSPESLMVRVLVAALLSVLAAPPVTAQAIAAINGSTQIKSTTVALPERISVTFENTPLSEAIMTIARRSGIRVAIDHSQLPKRQVTYIAESVTPEIAFTAILSGTGFKADRTSNGMIKVVKAGPGNTVHGQGVVTGKVTDVKSGKGISGASVSVGNDRSIATDEDGAFRLSGVPGGVQTITVRLVGYAKQTRSVVIGEGVTVTVDFKLEPSANVLDQVVVTGTVVASELRSVPNAITVITSKQIEERGIRSISQLFRGDIPGLFAVNQGSYAALDEVTMFSRGPTALSTASAGTALNTNPIKTYVDGVELADSKYLSQIDPRSIERIEILTGPQASTIYGSNAINGVMQVFTKRGTSSRPQLTLNLQSGWVENNLNSAKTPQHDYSAQVNGIEGRLSYNTGGSWNYIGAWTPSKQTARIGSFGGARIEIPTTFGRMTADVMFRYGVTQNLKRGDEFEALAVYAATGWYVNFGRSGLSAPTTSTLTGQTLGITLGYTPTNWWSHEFGMGQDASDTESRSTAWGYTTTADTVLSLTQKHTNQNSIRYTTTMRVPVTSVVQATITAGTDAWRNLSSSVTASPQTLTGTLTGTTTITRQPGHNTGSFLQTQLGIKDRLFFTYGLRAEWNPNFGEEVLPNYAPRYGVAYTQELGIVTAKLRGSYGRSTRPPQPIFKMARKLSAVTSASTWAFYSQAFRDHDYYIANPELGPEYQQGGEGGIELYLGTRGSLVVTRYNQTVDGLISNPKVDSVRSFIPCVGSCGQDSRDAEGYGYRYQSQYLNIGSIRNQGWELQSSVNVGPFTTRATYSWTKSRTIGINPKYRAFYANNSQYQPGATFQWLPEHTWALGFTYAKSGTTINLNITGMGQLENSLNDYYYRNLYRNIRLIQNHQNESTNTGGGAFVMFNSGYALADVTASQRFFARMEGVLQVQNLAGHYVKNDYISAYSTMGRQVKLGMRIRQ